MEKKLNALFIILVLAIIIIAPIKSHAASVISPGVTYDAHVQNIGWQNTWASNGYNAGTVGQAKRLEAVKIKLTGTLPTGASIQYSVHVQNMGWQDIVAKDGSEAGTEGKSLRLEAIKINLVNMPGFSVQYRVQGQTYGWQRWVTDGSIAGTVGQSKRLETLQVKIVPPIVNISPITPDAPAVVANDDITNKVTGMAKGMEYKLDASGYLPYVVDAFNKIDFNGVHTLLVRIAAEGINPAGTAKGLMFTTNPSAPVIPDSPATPITPNAPITVVNDDITNKVAGMAEGMEYKLDASNYIPYVADTFNAIDFTGNRTLLVRVAANGINPAGKPRVLTFTANPVAPDNITTLTELQSALLNNDSTIININDSIIVPKDKDIIIPSNVTVVVAANCTLTINSKLNLNGTIKGAPIVSPLLKMSMNQINPITDTPNIPKIEVGDTGSISVNKGSTMEFDNFSDIITPNQESVLLYAGAKVTVAGKQYIGDTNNDLIKLSNFNDSTAPVAGFFLNGDSKLLLTIFEKAEVLSIAVDKSLDIGILVKAGTTSMPAGELVIPNFNVIDSTGSIFIEANAKLITNGQSIVSDNDTTSVFNTMGGDINNKCGVGFFKTDSTLLVSIRGDVTMNKAFSITNIIPETYKSTLDTILNINFTPINGEFTGNSWGDIGTPSKTKYNSSANGIWEINGIPMVSRDDTTNKVIGMTEGMEYKLDEADYVPYVSDAFNLIDFSGDHTLLVRSAADGINPAGITKTIIFTTNQVVSVSYQGCTENTGWQNSVSDGQEAGTDGQYNGLDAIKIKLDGALPVGASIKYQTNVQRIGWQSWVSDWQEAGTDGKSLNVEAIKISLENMSGYSVEYQAYVQGIGWQNWVRDGQIAGTTGEALGIEAIRVRLVLKTTNSISVSLNKTTDVLVVGSTDTLSATITPIDAIDKDVVWTSSDSNIATVDITGKVTAISVGTATIIATTVDGSKIATCAVHVNKEIISEVSVTYQGYVQGIGWQIPVSDGQEAGTDGLNSRLEAIKIKLTDTLPGASIRYQTNVEGIGWQNSVKDDALEGTIGLNKRLEAIKINLENMPGYSVQYQTYIQNIGWQDWVSDGQISGTTGEALRIEAIKIRIVKN